MKAQYWETRMMQQSRENAYLKHSCESLILCMMKGEMLPVGSMRREPMPGRPELQKPVWQASRLVPRMNSSTSPQRDPEIHMVSRGVREFPHCPGLLRMPYHMGWNVPDVPPPHPPPQWWTWGPQPHLVPPPHGLQSQSEACGAQGVNSSTVPEKVPEKHQVNAGVFSVVPISGVLFLSGQHSFLTCVCWIYPGVHVWCPFAFKVASLTGVSVSRSSPSGCVSGAKAEFVFRA
ncbi:uncharacterized protein LOC122908956 [Neovison vison]|uniref:uncharacterized protein LOC122908956 n=1 Tax=Neovison vison TaxID=452646 RepID=UPI001CF09125|nr:uncharacterized protein LOC122908956 [Neogale vison]